MLGNAWKSVDVYNALIMALDADGERTSMALIARYRCLELVAQGKRSLVPGAPTGALLAPLVAEASNTVESERELEAQYRELRRESDAWHRARTDYLVARLVRGEHPDLVGRNLFWAGFKEPPLPEAYTRPEPVKGTYTPEDPDPKRNPSSKPQGLAPEPAQTAPLPLVVWLLVPALLSLVLMYRFRKHLGASHPACR